jgi:hypothetical protein
VNARHDPEAIRKRGDTTAKEVYIRLRFDLGVRGFEIGFVIDAK